MASQPSATRFTRADLDGEGFERTPELVIEVMSPSTRAFDRGVKRTRYAATGAVEVWLVDLDAGEILRFVTNDGPDAPPQVLGWGETVTTPLLPDFAADVDDLLGPPADRRRG